MLWIIFVATIILTLLTVCRYQSVLDWEKMRRSVSSKENLFTHGSYKYLLIELFLSYLIPYPFFINERIYFYNLVQGAEVTYFIIICPRLTIT